MFRRARHDPVEEKPVNRRARAQLHLPVKMRLFRQDQAAVIVHGLEYAARLGGLNEVIIVVLLAAKYGVPICPHGGGVGLCEYTQHISLFDYIAVSGSL